MGFIRATVRLILAIALTVVIFILSLVTLVGAPPARMTRRRMWAGALFRRLLRLWGVRIRTIGRPPNPSSPGVIVANHLSYLDIMILYTSYPLVFVAKEEIRSWPVIGWLTRYSGAIFAARNKPAAVRNLARELTANIVQHAWVCFFPEGRIGNGRTILPFKRGLLTLVKDLGVPVYYVVLSYLDHRLVWDTPSNMILHLWRWLHTPTQTVIVKWLDSAHYPDLAAGDSRRIHAVFQAVYNDLQTRRGTVPETVNNTTPEHRRQSSRP